MGYINEHASVLRNNIVAPLSAYMCRNILVFWNLRAVPVIGRCLDFNLSPLNVAKRKEAEMHNSLPPRSAVQFRASPSGEQDT